MYGEKVFLLYLTVNFTLIFYVSAVFGNQVKNNTVIEENSLEIFPYVKLQIHGKNIHLNWSLRSLFPSEDNLARKSQEKKNPLRRIGSMIMMIPIAMQMMSLPGAIASIKAQLLRSLFMGKIALIMIIYNAIRSELMKEVVVVHKIPPQHHDHYYHPEFDKEENSAYSWWGR